MHSASTTSSSNALHISSNRSKGKKNQTNHQQQKNPLPSGLCKLLSYLTRCQQDVTSKICSYFFFPPLLANIEELGYLNLGKYWQRTWSLDDHSYSIYHSLILWKYLIKSYCNIRRNLLSLILKGKPKWNQRSCKIPWEMIWERKTGVGFFGLNFISLGILTNCYGRILSYPYSPHLFPAGNTKIGF